MIWFLLIALHIVCGVLYMASDYRRYGTLEWVERVLGLLFGGVVLLAMLYHCTTTRYGMRPRVKYSGKPVLIHRLAMSNWFDWSEIR